MVRKYRKRNKPSKKFKKKYSITLNQWMHLSKKEQKKWYKKGNRMYVKRRNLNSSQPKSATTKDVFQDKQIKELKKLVTPNLMKFVCRYPVHVRLYPYSLENGTNVNTSAVYNEINTNFTYRDASYPFVAHYLPIRCIKPNYNAEITAQVNNIDNQPRPWVAIPELEESQEASISSRHLHYRFVVGYKRVFLNPQGLTQTSLMTQKRNEDRILNTDRTFRCYRYLVEMLGTTNFPTDPDDMITPSEAVQRIAEQLPMYDDTIDENKSVFERTYADPQQSPIKFKVLSKRKIKVKFKQLSYLDNISDMTTSTAKPKPNMQYYTAVVQESIKISMNNRHLEFTGPRGYYVEYTAGDDPIDGAGTHNIEPDNVRQYLIFRFQNDRIQREFRTMPNTNGNYAVDTSLTYHIKDYIQIRNNKVT